MSARMTEATVMPLERTAIHEAGHVVVAWILGLVSTEVVLTFEQADETGSYGYTTCPNPVYGYNHCSRRDVQRAMHKQSTVSCAGLAAEHVFFGVPLDTSNENAMSDFENVMELERQGLRTARRYCVGHLGDEGTWRFIDRRLRAARDIVRRHRDTIQRLALVLIAEKRLDQDKLERLLGEWLPR